METIQERGEFVQHLLQYAFDNTDSFEAPNFASLMLYLVLAIMKDTSVALVQGCPSNQHFIDFLQSSDEIWKVAENYIFWEQDEE